MKEEFYRYLESVGITKVLISRIEYLYNVLNSLIDEELEDIFINEYIKEDGSRQYEHLKYFTKNYFISAINFINLDNYSISLKTSEMSLIKLESINYDFKEATTNSRLTLTCRYVGQGDIILILKASGSNYDRLINIYNKHIKKYIKKNS